MPIQVSTNASGWQTRARSGSRGSGLCAREGVSVVRAQLDVVRVRVVDRSEKPGGVGQHQPVDGVDFGVRIRGREVAAPALQILRRVALRSGGSAQSIEQLLDADNTAGRDRGRMVPRAIGQDRHGHV